MQLSIVEIAKPADANVIVGQAHFIKTVEDVYEALVQAVPNHGGHRGHGVISPNDLLSVLRGWLKSR